MTDTLHPNIPMMFTLRDVEILDTLALVPGTDTLEARILDVNEAAITVAAIGTFEAAPAIGGTGTDTKLGEAARISDEEITIDVGATNALTVAVGDRIQISGQSEVYRVKTARTAIAALGQTTVRLDRVLEVGASVSTPIYGVAVWEFSIPAVATVTEGATYWVEVKIDVASISVLDAIVRRRLVGGTSHEV